MSIATQEIPVVSQTPREVKEDLKQLDNDELIRRYKETGDNELKWELVLRFEDQIRRVALRTLWPLQQLQSAG